MSAIDLAGKKILVTGGAGFLGQEVVAEQRQTKSLFLARESTISVKCLIVKRWWLDRIW
jgi:nucleoside-diphosphate-sugar epimerase